MLYHIQSFHVDWHLQTGMCQTMVQECTAHCANTNCWPLCSCQLQLPDSIPPLSWSGLLSRERAPWFWTCTHSTVRWTGGSMEAVCANPDVHLNYLPQSPFFFFFFLSQMKRWQVKWSHGPQESSWPRGFFFAGNTSLCAVCLLTFNIQQCSLWLFMCWHVTEGWQRLSRAGQYHFWLMTAGQI